MNLETAAVRWMLVDLALHRYVRLCFFRAITVSLGAPSLLLPRSQKRPKLSYVAIVPMILFGCSRSVTVTGSLGRPLWKICTVSDRRQVLGFASE